MSLSWLSDIEPTPPRPAVVRISKDSAHEHPPITSSTRQIADPVAYIQKQRRISDPDIPKVMRYAVRSLNAQGITDSRDIIRLLNAVVDRWGVGDDCFDYLSGWHTTTMPKLMAEHRYNRHLSNGVGLLLYKINGGKTSVAHDDADDDENNAA